MRAEDARVAQDLLVHASHQVFRWSSTHQGVDGISKNSKAAHDDEDGDRKTRPSVKLDMPEPGNDAGSEDGPGCDHVVS